MLSTLSACYEGYSRDSAGPKLLAMQELHRRLAQRLVLLHRERYKAVAVRLHSRVCDQLLLVLLCGSRTCCRRCSWEGVQGQGWMTDTSVMEMPWVRTRRMSPRAWTHVAKLSAEVPAPSARPKSQRRAGLRAEAVPARCTARRKIPFRISWRSVVSAARAEHCMPWLASMRRRVAPHPHAAALHCGGVQGQHGEAKAVLEACLDLTALELERPRERYGIQHAIS
jgi:hypothetical protein